METAMGSLPVSVVMSVFNGQKFLSAAVDSILSQTFSDFEFLIIDDGSTDGTAEILNGFASRDSRVRIFRQENKGRAVSLNIGIGLAKGRYIARMDADDVALAYRLEEQIEFIERHPEICVLGGGVELVNSTGSLIKVYQPPLVDAEIKLAMRRYNPMCHPSVILRKEVAIAAGGYRKALLDADDYDLWLRMTERGEIGNLGSTILRYRLHSEQASIRNMRHQTLCVLASRAAASLRKSGHLDPLASINEVTLELVRTLGVSAAEIQQQFLEVYQYWSDLFIVKDPEVALIVTNAVLELSGSEKLERRALADAWLKAASIHYRLGRLLEAIMSVGHAVLVRPMVAGRPFKRALRRFAVAAKG